MSYLNIAQLPLAIALTGSEQLLGDQNGTTVAISISQIAAIALQGAGGANTEVLYNSLGLQAGNVAFTFNAGTQTLSVTNVAVTGALTTPSLIVSTALSAPAFIATESVAGALTAGAFSYGTMQYADTENMATFAASANGYAQIQVQNYSTATAASADVIVANSTSTAATGYGDFGINGPTFAGVGSLGAANMVYAYAAGTDITIGTSTPNAIHFVVGGGAVDAVTITSGGNVVVNPPSAGIALSIVPVTGTGTALAVSAPATGRAVISLAANGAAIGVGDFYIGQQADNSVYLLNRSAKSIVIGTSGAPSAITLANTGGVVIAAPSTSTTLTVTNVRGVIADTGTAAGPAWRMTASSTYNAYFGLYEATQTNGWWLSKATGAAGAFSIGFGASEGSGTTVLTATQSGNVSISAPSAGDTLALASSGAVSAYMINMTASGALSNWVRFNDTQGSGHAWAVGPGVGGSTQFGVYDQSRAALALSISTAGNIVAGAPSGGVGLTLNAGTGGTTLDNVYTSSTSAIVPIEAHENATLRFSVTVYGTAYAGGSEYSAGAGSIAISSEGAFPITVGTQGAAAVGLGTNNVIRFSIGSAGNAVLASPSSGVALSVTGYTAGGSPTSVFDSYKAISTVAGTYPIKFAASSDTAATYGFAIDGTASALVLNRIDVLTTIAKFGASGDVFARGVALCKFKTGDSTSTSTTPTADADLQVALAANTTYDFEVYLQFGGDATSITHGLNAAPYYSGTFTTNSYSWLGCLNASGTAATRGTANNVTASSATTNVVTTGSIVLGTTDFILMKGRITTTGAGTFGINWGQNATGTGTTTIYRSSYMKVTQLS